jgi:hypothetical protein
MGCDGGTINASRADLVKVRKIEKHVNDKDTAQGVVRFTTCAISQEPLKQPVVACRMGNLYNKEAILEYLLSKAPIPRFAHIKTLKDVFAVKLTYPEASAKDKGADGSTTSSATAPVEARMAGVASVRPFICPVTFLPANGRYPFVVKTSCGCIFSKKALLEVPSTTCLGCGRMLPTDAKEAASENIPLLSMSGAELMQLKKNLEEWQAKQKKLAKQKKEKAKADKKANKDNKDTTNSTEEKHSGNSNSSNSSSSSSSTSTNSNKSTDPKVKAEANDSTSSGVGSATDGSSRKRKAISAGLNVMTSNGTSAEDSSNNNHSHSRSKKAPITYLSIKKEEEEFAAKRAKLPTSIVSAQVIASIDNEFKNKVATSQVYKSLFVTKATKAALAKGFQTDYISTKPRSLMSRL